MSPSEAEGPAEEFRTPSTAEEQIMSALLRAEFPGDAALREQMSKALVRRIDADGSLEVSVTDGPRAEFVRRTQSRRRRRTATG